MNRGFVIAGGLPLLVRSGGAVAGRVLVGFRCGEPGPWVPESHPWRRDVADGFPNGAKVTVRRSWSAFGHASRNQHRADDENT